MKGAKTIILVGGAIGVGLLASKLFASAKTQYSIDVSDIDLVSVQPWTIELVRSVPNIKTKVTLGIANPSLYDLKLTYVNLEMYFGKIKFGEIADNKEHIIEANNPKFMLDLWGYSSIVPMFTNGLVDAFLSGKLPENIRIKGYLRVNGDLIAIDFVKPFKIPENFIGLLKERLHDLFPNNKW